MGAAHGSVPDGNALPVPAGFGAVIDYDVLADRVITRLLRRVAELSPGELATLKSLLSPRTGPEGELKIVLALALADAA
jgi:hypothetical protein